MKLTHTPEDLEHALLVIVPILIAGIILFLCWSCDEVFAQEWKNEEIVRAIYYAEGGTKAKKPFGILSVPCNGYDECRKICENTVRNNRKRYAEWGYKTHPDYLSFLAHRYAPTTNATNDPTGLNSNWLRNVRAILERNRQ